MAEKPDQPPSPWLTADQAAAYLGLPSRAALYGAIRRGQVQVHRLGRRMRFSVHELVAALMAGPAIRSRC